MNDQPDTKGTFADGQEISQTMADIAESSQKLVADFLARQARSSPGGAPGGTPGAPGSMDPFNIGGAFMEMTARMMADPAKMIEANMSLWRDYLELWQSTATRMMGGEAEPAISPDPGDQRFKDASWSDNDVFDYIKQSYLLTSRWLQTTVADVDGMDDKSAQKVDFHTRRFVEALSPGNFVLTNPEVLKETAETGGQNLLNG